MPRTTENHMKIYVTCYYKKKKKKKVHFSTFLHFGDMLISVTLNVLKHFADLFAKK